MEPLSLNTVPALKNAPRNSPPKTGTPLMPVQGALAGGVAVPVNSPSIIEAISSLAASNKSINTIDRGSMQDIKAEPSQTIITINSNNDSGSGTKTIYLLNNDVMQGLVTDNGSGAGSITYQFNDGFNGNIISNIFTAYGNIGLMAKQVQFKMQNNTTTLQDGSALTASQPAMNGVNGDGSAFNQIIPMQSTGNPMYLQTGFLIVDVDIYWKRYSQMSLILPKDTTATVIVVWDYARSKKAVVQ